MNEMPSKSPSSAPTTQKSWYQRWHMASHHYLVHWGIFLIAVAVTWSLVYTKLGNWIFSFSDPGATVQLNSPNTELSLDPQTAIVKVGDIIAANIVIDTKGQPIDGVDIYALHYDPSLLQVQDDVPSKSGVQIKPGVLPDFSTNAANIVDKTSGTIKYSQISTPGTNYKGKGILATAHFKALASGTAFLKFDFTPGNTIDSNAAYRGRDRLSKVVDAIYTVEK